MVAKCFKGLCNKAYIAVNGFSSLLYRLQGITKSCLASYLFFSCAAQWGIPRPGVFNTSIAISIPKVRLVDRMAIRCNPRNSKFVSFALAVRSFHLPLTCRWRFSTPAAWGLGWGAPSCCLPAPQWQAAMPIYHLPPSDRLPFTLSLSLSLPEMAARCGKLAWTLLTGGPGTRHGATAVIMRCFGSQHSTYGCVCACVPVAASLHTCSACYCVFTGQHRLVKLQ